MFKYLYAGISLFVFLNVTQIAFAQDPRAKIDGDQLQQEAEQVFNSEPGARQVTVRVEVEPVDTGKNVVDLYDFDLNKDGVFERDEIGEKLFEIFDIDRNRVIDNREMLKPRLIVITPMERKTIEIVDYHDPSKPTKQEVSQEQFMQQSNLSKFDKDQDGLSPLDFVEKSFNEVNVRKDGVIDLYEWKRAYEDSIRPLLIEDYNYNN